MAEQSPMFLIDTDNLVLGETEEIEENVFEGDKGTITAVLKNSDKTIIPTPLELEATDSDSFILHVAEIQSFVPGKYTLEATVSSGGTEQTITQDFMWGVLALNFNQSTYKTGEKAVIGMAVLDDQGKTLCDATLTLTITDVAGNATELSTENQKIAASELCVDKSVTNEPDYRAEFIAESEGEYSVSLVAETANGPRDLQATLRVTNEADIVVERKNTSMRIYPVESYKVTTIIKANRDVYGGIKEPVPANFELSEISNNGTIIDKGEQSQTISWPIKMKKGETFELSYVYDAPDISPEFYLLGPLSIWQSTLDIESGGEVLETTIFSEPRAWQIASDAVANNGRIFYGDATNTVMRFQNLTSPFSFGGELSYTHGASASLIRFIVAKPAITRDEVMVGLLKADGQLTVVKGINGYDAGTDYSTAWSNTGTGPAMTCENVEADCSRSFDIAYERLSGRAMVVYADNVNQKLYYCYWDGTNWGPVSTCAPTNGSNDLTLTSNGRPAHVSLKPKSGSNDILMGVGIDVSGTHEVEAYRWDGDSWENGVVATDTTDSIAAANNQGAAFDVEWDGDDAMVIYATTAAVEVKYKLLTSGSWGSETDAFNTAANGSSVLWLNAEADPSSNRIAVTTNDSANDLTAAVWKADGTTVGWTEVASDTTLEGSNGTTAGPAYTDLQWERFGSEFIIVLQDLGNSDNADYIRLSCDGTGCSITTAQASIPSTASTDDNQFIRLANSPNGDDLMVISSDLDRNLFAQHWNGTAWESGDSGVLEADVSNCSADNVATGCSAMPGVFAYIPYSSWQRNWRFFDDETVDNPSTGLNGAAENATPTDVSAEEIIRLRVNVAELSGMGQTDARKKLQYASGCDPNASETACTWADVGDTSETSAVWRYATTGESCSGCADGSTSTTSRLTGTNHGSPSVFYVADKDAAADVDFDHTALLIREIDFPLKAENVAGSTTYYFRLYDVDQERAVRREQDNDGANDCASATCTYPSLTTEAPVITVDGIVRTTDESTAYDCSTDNLTIGIVVNGGTSQTTTCTLSTGAFSLATVTAPQAGQPVVVYIDSAETPKGTSITLANDSTSTITLDIYRDRVRVTHDSAGPMINSSMATGDNGNAGIRYAVSGGNLTVEDTMELHITTSKTFTPGGNVTTPKMHVVGTYTGGSETLTLSGTGTGTSRPLSIDGGTFTAGGTSITKYTGDGTTDLQHTTYQDLQLTPTLTASQAYTFTTGVLTINGNFDINPTASTTTKTLTVNLGGTTTVAATKTLTITGTTTGASNLDTTSANSYSLTTGLMNITNTGSGGTLTANASTITLNATSGTLWTQTGTFTAGTSTVVMNPDADVTLTSNNTITFYNVSLTPAISTAGRTYTFGTSALAINGDFTINPSGTQLLTVNPAADITVAATKTTTITRTSTATSTLDLRPVSTDYNLATGLLQVATGGTLDAAGSISIITLSATSGTLFTRTGTFTVGTSEVRATGAGNTTLLSAATTFHKLIINPTGTNTVSAGAGITVNDVSGAALDIQSGKLNDGGNQITGPGATNGTLTVAASAELCLGGNTSCITSSTTATTLPVFNSYTLNATSTVSYLADAAQTVDGTPTYGNVQLIPVITSARVYDFEASTTPTINGNFTINPTAASALALTVNLAGTITVAATKTTTITKTTSATSLLDLRPVSTDYNLATGALTIESGGTLDATGAISTITISGNYTNNGTFTAGNSTVTLNGASTQTLSGGMVTSNAFYNLTLTNASGTDASDCERTGYVAGVVFAASATSTNNYVITTASVRVTYNSGSTYTFTNINWNGQAAGTRIYFRNSAVSGTWLLNVSGTQTAVSYVNVSRSDASGGNQIAASDTTNVDCNNNPNWDFTGAATYEQVDYRFGSGDTVTIDYTGAPAENTALAVTSTGQDIRLRMLIHVAGATLGISGETFKLRFGEKPAAGCASATYADVSPSSGVIRYEDNATPADGDNIASVGGDPDHAGHTKNYQDYEEANNFTNSVSSIPAGEDGVWDFSLENFSAVGGKTYCFKITKSDGTDLTTYTFFPEITIREELTFTLDATSKNFGTITPGSAPSDQTSTVTTTTNAASGYQVTLFASQLLTKLGGDTIANWTGTNTAPTELTGAGASAFGYTTNDSNLGGGTVDRFTSASNLYAGFVTTGPGDIVADSTTGPVSAQAFTITYRLRTAATQKAGLYSTTLIYINTAGY